MATEKQKKAVKLTLENLGKNKPLTKKEILKEAGYGEIVQDQPKQVFESSGFKELIDKYLPEDKLLKAHVEGLNAYTKKPHLIDRDENGRPIYDYVPEADFSVRHKYLDTAYKIKGAYPKEPGNNFLFNFGDIRKEYD